jgi:hypothetical protein
MVMESRLLGKHRRKHVELPPLNRQQPLKNLQDFFKAIGRMSNRQIDDELEEDGVAAIRRLEKLVETRTKPNPGA